MAYQPGAYSASQTRQPAYAPSQQFQQSASSSPAPPTAVNIPPGTLPPGTIVRVGEYEVRVDKWLSEGGFAHVYLASSSTAIPAGSPSATTKHVLKRMVVPDKKGVEEVGKEVEVMKLLRNHPRIVNMIEASVSDLPGGTDGSKGYEIYILMEWCAGGGIIDMMNTRLQNRLTETEILKIFSDTVEAVAHMHYQNPPLIHRDLKVENILLSPPQTFKLCDFGSTTTPLPPEKVPTAVEAIQKLELDINRTTTLQYRAPELVDVWGRKGFDEKIDIWALGVFLYKLCYYTTPFEEHGPLAILSAQYKIPPYPAYSNSVKGLIGAMLQESPSQRPNIYQVHEQVCRLRGTAVKIDNKYANASSSSRPSSAAAPSNGSAYSNILNAPTAPTEAPAPSLAETISPMRRGRPTKGGIACAVPPALDASDNRMVKTGGTNGGREWEALGGNANGGGSAWPTGKSAPSTGSSNGFGDAFSALPPMASSSSPATASFGDAFTPSTTATTTSPPTSAGFSPPANPAMFADLLPPSKSPAPPGPMVASASQQGAPKSNLTGGLASLSTEGWRSRPSSSAGIAARASPAPTPAPVPIVDAGDDKDDFESKFPSLDDVEAFSPPVKSLTGSTAFAPTTKATGASSPSSGAGFSSSPSFGTAFTPSSGRAPPPITTKLTGEPPAAPGPALPRRPPSSAASAPTPIAAPAPTRSPLINGRPELVSRGSQTSPHLMATWRPPGSSSNLKQSTLPPLTQPSNSSSSQPISPISPLSVALPGMASSNRKVPSRSTSISSQQTAHSASSERVALPGLTTGGSSSSNNTNFSSAPPSRTPAFDLLGDDDENEDAFAPKPVASSNRPTFKSSSPAPPPLPPKSDPPASSSTTSRLNKRMSFGGIPDGGALEASREKFRPVRSNENSSAPVSRRMSLVNSNSSNVTAKPEQKDDTAESRFPPLESLDQSAALPAQQESWQKIAEKEDEGESSDEEVVETMKTAPVPDEEDDFAPRAMSRPLPEVPSGPSPIPAQATPATLPPITRVESTDSEGGGGIDLGPALSSIRRFAPTTTTTSQPQPPPPTTDSHLPPLVAPKPQRNVGGINSVVSRYEALSTNPTGSSATSGKSAPPLVGNKPAGLRRDSISAKSPNTSSNPTHWASRQASASDFTSRYPDSNSPLLDSVLASAPSTPPTTTSSPSFSLPKGDRQPFKPVGPPSTPKQSRPLPSLPPVSPPNDASKSKSGEDGDEEVPFAGVSNMRNRWETLTKGAAKTGPGGQGKPRKEFGVV